MRTPCNEHKLQASVGVKQRRRYADRYAPHIDRVNTRRRLKPPRTLDDVVALALKVRRRVA